MNFKQWLLSEDIFPNKTATVYHRTCNGCTVGQSVMRVSSLLTSDFEAGKGAGCMLGCGLYTTFALESQFALGMAAYGKAVVKFKVIELDKYLVWQLMPAKQIHGKNYKISDQLKKLGLSNKVDQNELNGYDEQQEKEMYTSELAVQFYHQNRWIENSIKGMIYRGRGDGYCLLKYPKVEDGTITMLGYAVADDKDKKKMEELEANRGWIKSVGALGTPIKNVYKSTSSNKEKFSFGDNSYITKYLIDAQKSNKLELAAEKLGSEHINKLSDQNVSDLLKGASDKEKMINIVLKYKPNISDDDFNMFIIYATDKDRFAELVISQKSELSDGNISSLLGSVADKEKIAKLIVSKKSEFSDDNVRDLMHASTERDQMAKLIIDKSPKITSENLSSFIFYVSNKYEIAELSINKSPEILTDDIASLLLGNIQDKDRDKIVMLLLAKLPKLSERNIDNIISSAYGTSLSDNTIELIISRGSHFVDDNFRNLLHYASDKNKISKLIIQKQPEISDQNVQDLIYYPQDKTEILDLIWKKLKESESPISDSAIGQTLQVTEDKDKDRVINDMIKILQEKNQEISLDVFSHFARYATDKLKIAIALIKIKKQLSFEEASILIRNAKDGKEMARLIDKPYSFLKSLTSWDAFRYKKLPEVQDMIVQVLKRSRFKSRFKSGID